MATANEGAFIWWNFITFLDVFRLNFFVEDVSQIFLPILFRLKLISQGVPKYRYQYQCEQRAKVSLRCFKHQILLQLLFSRTLFNYYWQNSKTDVPIFNHVTTTIVTICHRNLGTLKVKTLLILNFWPMKRFSLSSWSSWSPMSSTDMKVSWLCQTNVAPPDANCGINSCMALLQMALAL